MHYNNCQFNIMGRDGIYFKNGSRNITTYPYNMVVIQPGSRADISVMCTTLLVIIQFMHKILMKLIIHIWPTFLFNAPTPRYKNVDISINCNTKYNCITCMMVNGLLRPYNMTDYLQSTLDKDIENSNPFCSVYPNATKPFTRC